MGRDLEREVFGGSESELSSDEEEDLSQNHQKPSKARSPSQTHTRRDEHLSESSAGDSDDEYKAQGPKASASAGAGAVGKAKKKSKRRASAPGAGGVEGDAGEGGEGGKTSKKRKRKQPVEVDLSELPPEQAAKLRLDLRLDEILKSKKSKPRKKKNTDSEVLDSFADDQVARLREAMNNAADEDIRANQEKQPALAKLRMLVEVVGMLRKSSLAQSIIDNNLLDALRRWLEPLPDKSLPALNIQREFFTLLPRMEFIDSSVLKESGLGRIVIFYTKCKRVNPDIARTANDLVSLWSRPIIKRSASYRDRVIPIAQNADSFSGPLDPSNPSQSQTQRHPSSLAQILALAAQSEKGRVRKNAVSIPQRELGTYTIAPKDLAGLSVNSRSNKESVDRDVERRRVNGERLRMLSRKVVGRT
ncbi:hypothetical protein CPB83DRAFT_844599 [Crepidotus variabilis]|uniref:TFIIS N-terminal domain-containing protein n=1 Tax=Crepidotus variabilis TaxID=179855 RepID=A0A9P6ER25_9AGAR|nr:hypothetical protein CPB83DRAFT_844599 [Crepidotus variabilis]